MHQMQEKAQIMDEKTMARAITRIGHEIIERNQDLADVVLIGIQRRGVPLAQRIAKGIEEAEGVALPLGYLDITLYRDDLSELTEHPIVNDTSIPFAVGGKTIVLVDDVIYTGRTVRSAIDALIDLGRPKSIQLAAMIDRGHRELPIRPDYVGKNVPTSKSELIGVRVTEIDGEDSIWILE